jgi:hypothetical protein
MIIGTELASTSAIDTSREVHHVHIQRGRVRARSPRVLSDLAASTALSGARAKCPTVEGHAGLWRHRLHQAVTFVAEANQKQAGVELSVLDFRPDADRAGTPRRLGLLCLDRHAVHFAALQGWPIVNYSRSRDAKIVVRKEGGIDPISRPRSRAEDRDPGRTSGHTCSPSTCRCG